MNNKMTGKFLVWGYRENDLRSQISIAVNNNLMSSLTIRPVNRMTGLFTVLERPLEKYYLTPIKDSTIRESIPTLNYGSDPGMMVGVDEYSGEKFRSLIQFDLSSIPSGKTLKRAILKIYCNPFSTDFLLSVFSLLDNWQEKDVTWANQPREGEKITSKNITVLQNGTIEIDILPLVQKWYQRLLPNYGMLLIADDETKIGSVFLLAKESGNPPMLELGFEMPVFSDGQSSLRSSITVQANGESKLLSRIYVISKYRENYLHSLIRVEEKNNSSSLLSSINVKVQRPTELKSVIQVNKIEGSNSLLSSIIAKQRKENDLKSVIQVNKIQGNSSLLSSITAKQKKENDLLSLIQINKIERSNTLLSSITAKQKKENDLLSSITVPTRNDLRAQIRVEYANHLLSSIYVKHNNDLLSQMYVIGREENDLHSSITVQVKMASDLLSSIRVVDIGSKSNYAYAFII